MSGAWLGRGIGVDPPLAGPLHLLSKHGAVNVFLSFLLRRLRDKLIENESLALAMEVTTKCGLDPGAVWGAWGLSFLQVGKFKEAREKFSKFLKVCFYSISYDVSYDDGLRSAGKRFPLA